MCTGQRLSCRIHGSPYSHSSYRHDTVRNHDVLASRFLPLASAFVDLDSKPLRGFMTLESVVSVNEAAWVASRQLL